MEAIRHCGLGRLPQDYSGINLFEVIHELSGIRGINILSIQRKPQRVANTRIALCFNDFERLSKLLHINSLHDEAVIVYIGQWKVVFVPILDIKILRFINREKESVSLSRVLHHHGQQTFIFVSSVKVK